MAIRRSRPPQCGHARTTEKAIFCPHPPPPGPVRPRLVGEGLPNALVPQLGWRAFSSASACSSQNRMSISRYIVVAVVRCSCACSRLPVRR